MSRFLIIDDNVDKYDQIKRELLENGIREESIDWAKSKKSALKYMSKERYLVAFLDLNLPEFDDKTPIDKGGLEILEKINLAKHSKRYKKPNYVICLSAYKEIREAQVNKFLNLDLSIHDFESNSWKSALKSKLNWGLDIKNDKENVRNSNRIMCITVHGIRTQGKWQEHLEKSLKNKFDREIVCKKYRYNYFSATKLLFPRFRNKVIEDFKIKLIGLLEENPEAKVVFFAHSFGTYILMKALESLPRDVDINIERIVLAGCVLKESYDFDSVANVVEKSKIVNDCGYNDGILLLSKYFCSDMGLAGRSGFIGMDINNRYFKGSHDFFYKTNNFIEEYWLPLVDGKVTLIDERRFSPFRENWEILITSKFNLAILFLSLFLLVFIIILIVVYK